MLSFEWKVVRGTAAQKTQNSTFVIQNLRCRASDDDLDSSLGRIVVVVVVVS